MAHQRFTQHSAKMLCHVTRPDSVVMEVEVDAKANGEDCLNKVVCGGNAPLFIIIIIIVDVAVAALIF